MRKPAGFGLVLLFALVLSASGPQAIIHDSGSTNSPGIRVAVDAHGNAIVEGRGGETHDIKLPEGLCRRFMHEVKEAGPLNMLPAEHCLKSASFGSRIMVEFNGNTSPDLSCPVAPEPRLAGLQQDTKEILRTAREMAGIHGRRIVSVPITVPPKSE